MRIWQDAHSNLITDEQLVRRVAAFDSLSRALETGDIRLEVSTDADEDLAEDSRSAGRRRAHATLSAFLWSWESLPGARRFMAVTSRG